VNFNDFSGPEVGPMKGKSYLAGMAVAAALLTALASGCGTSAPYKNPEVEATKQRTQGTADELSPVAPVGGQKVRKVGNQWMCEQNGRTMIYNDAASCWEPQSK
jgi:hypothetical protein